MELLSPQEEYCSGGGDRQGKQTGGSMNSGNSSARKGSLSSTSGAKDEPRRSDNDSHGSNAGDSKSSSGGSRERCITMLSPLNKPPAPRSPSSMAVNGQEEPRFMQAPLVDANNDNDHDVDMKKVSLSTKEVRVVDAIPPLSTPSKDVLKLPDGGSTCTPPTVRAESDGSSMLPPLDTVVVPTVHCASALAAAQALPPPSPPSVPRVGKDLHGYLQSRLFERAAEINLVREFYQQALLHDGNHANMLLITGPSGTGKTRLANTIRPLVEDDHGGYFVTGKLDHLCRPEPYTVFVTAFTELTRKVLARGHVEVLEMRDAIATAVRDEANVLTSMIPALEHIMTTQNHEKQQKRQGDMNSSSALHHYHHHRGTGIGAGAATAASAAKADDALQRFVFVFRMFLRAVCTPERPLVLLLDDLQYADPCSIDILALVVADIKNDGLVLIGTCDTSVSPGSYLATKLREMQDQGQVKITNITLGNLSDEAVNRLVSDALQADPKDTANLTQMVINLTHGNMFDVLELLRWLQESNLLVFDDDAGVWIWHDDEIRMMTENYVMSDFLVVKLKQLSDNVKEVLKVAACLGANLQHAMLDLLLGHPVTTYLAEAAAHGILIFDESRGGYIFGHDGIQQAAYNLIRVEDRELFHLEIGRRIWRNMTSEEELDQHLFLLLSQMHIGWRLITKDKERHGVATLCLAAGTKAAKSSTFRTAAVYLNLGIMLLDNQSWNDDYDLSLALHNAAAEMEMCNANFERMEAILRTIFLQARNFQDKLNAYKTRIYALGVSDRQQEAIDLGIEVLLKLGEPFPKRKYTARVFGKFKMIHHMLQSKSDEQLLRLPSCTNSEKLQAMQILQLLILNSLLVRPRFAPYVVLKMMKLTLSYGLSALSSTAFAMFGLLVVKVNGDAEEAFRYGEIGLKLLERYEAMEYLPRVYAAFYGCIWSWKKPLKEALGPLLHAHKVGMQTGDVEFASLCANLYCFHATDAGVPLDVIHQEWQGFQELMISTRQHSLLRMAMPSVQAIHHFMGLSRDPLSAQGDIFDYDIAWKQAERMGNNAAMMGIQLTRMTVQYLFGAHDEAAKHCQNVLTYVWQMPPTFEQVTALTFGGLITMSMTRKYGLTRSRQRQGRKIVKLFRKWARTAPDNCLDRRFLLEAELASVQGNKAKAYEKYLCSIAIAKQAGFLFMHAVANEHAARHLYRNDDLDGAAPFFREACVSYEQWGGKAKVAQLTAEIDQIYDVYTH